MFGDDWQTIVVTIVALVALVVVVRRVLDLRGVKQSSASARKPSCPSCAPGEAACSTPARDASTVQHVQVIRKRASRA